jgi:hypothetical protein
MAHPPAVAQALVAVLVPADRRDGILGDLLEEYRETQRPERGEAGADRWYVRQAAGFVWRAAAPWAVAFGLAMAARECLDATVATTDNYHVRSAVSTYLAFVIYAAAGLNAGWRSRRLESGFVVSLVMTTVATLMTLATVFAVAALQAAGSAGILPSYAISDGLDIPVPFMLILGGVFATIGAAIGKAGRSMPRVDVT